MPNPTTDGVPDLPGGRPMAEPRLVRALLQPPAYPHGVDAVTLRRTHLSLVFLVAGFAYKLKRSVDLGFVDFRTLEARRVACEAEVRLNRRLAPSVYLGVSAIVRHGDDDLRVIDRAPADDEEVVDWAVRMQRVPDDRLLDALLADHRVTGAELDRLGDMVGDFLAERPVEAASAAHGAPEAVARKFESHLDRMDEATDGDGVALHPAPFRARLRRWTEAWLLEHESLLAERRARGHVREGHGDLHAGNIALVDGAWLALDCVEFRHDFRCLDWIAEAAVLTLDIAHRTGNPTAATRLFRRIAARTEPGADDANIDLLRRAYAVHYAAVRAHVGALRALDRDASTRPDIARREAQAYLHHAVGLTIRPGVTLLCGLPGSGKTVVARTVARALEATVLSSDPVRKALAGLAPNDRSGRASESTLYDPAMNDRVLDALRTRAASALADGGSVVIDATNGRRAWRDAFRAVARGAGVPARLIRLDPPDATIRERLRERIHDPAQASDADERVYDRHRATFEPPDEWPRECRVTIRDAGSADDVVETFLLALCDDSPGPDRRP